MISKGTYEAADKILAAIRRRDTKGGNYEQGIREEVARIISERERVVKDIAALRSMINNGDFAA